MDSPITLQLKAIDFTDLTKDSRGTLVWDSRKNQVFKALQENGNGISLDLEKSIFASLEQLFDLPLATKSRNIPSKIINGYIGQSKNLPLYESLGIEDVESFTNLMWPHQDNHTFSKNMQSYSEKLSMLDEIVRMMVLESLNMEKYVNEHMELTSYLVRVMKYRVHEKNESNTGLAGHTDKNIMTILHENEVGGLEIQNKQGEWIRPKVSTNSFVVMASESFNVWTNGRLHAPVHRVLMNGDKTRYFVGFFSVPKPGKMVSAPDEMADEKHPLLFKPFDYGEFMKFFFEKENIGNRFAMKKYCGISY